MILGRNAPERSLGYALNAIARMDLQKLALSTLNIRAGSVPAILTPLSRSIAASPVASAFYMIPE